MLLFVFASEFKFYLLLPPLLLLAWLRPGWGRTFFDRAEAAVSRLAKRRWLAVAAVGLTAFAASCVPALIRMPAPKIHDEFSYLLAADTFAHGRLTNPTHPLWPHFESIHIIQQPSYNSKYPPGQGVALALGQVLGHPILGVWLSLAVACASVCWMLQAWLPARWAFAGGLLMAIHPQIITWGYNYWGGAVAMTGGALLCGGMRRIVDTRREGAWPFGAGLLILANSRPYEGLVLSTSTIAAGIFVIIRASGAGGLREVVRQCGIPLFAFSLLTIFSLGFYNYRVTGSPLHMPYSEHVRQYLVEPIFVGEKFRPEPVYRHREIREFYVKEEVDLTLARHGFLYRSFKKFQAQGQNWLWMGLWLPPLLALPWRWRHDLWLHVAAVCLGGQVAALLAGQGLFPQYAAPGVALFVLLMVEGLRQLRLWRRSHGTGLAFTRWLCVLCLLTVPVVWGRTLAKNAEGWFRDRERVLAQLGAMPGKHLVLMRYALDHNPNREWVFNAADLDRAKILWAREMDAEADFRLLAYFHDRTVWVVEPDQPNPQPHPYFPKPSVAPETGK